MFWDWLFIGFGFPSTAGAIGGSVPGGQQVLLNDGVTTVLLNGVTEVFIP